MSKSSFSSFYPAKNEENCGRGVVFGSTAGEGWCRGLKGHSAREVDGAGGDIYSNEGFSFF